MLLTANGIILYLLLRRRTTTLCHGRNRRALCLRVTQCQVHYRLRCQPFRMANSCLNNRRSLKVLQPSSTWMKWQVNKQPSITNSVCWSKWRRPRSTKQPNIIQYKYRKLSVVHFICLFASTKYNSCVLALRRIY